MASVPRETPDSIPNDDIPSFPRVLGGEAFSTKTSAGDRAKLILHSTPVGNAIDGIAESVVLDLFLLNREQSARVLRACVRIFVRENKAGSPGFYVEGVSTSSSHFGIGQCISPRDPRAALKHALQIEIDDQLREFRKRTFREGMVCPVTGAPMVRGSIHAHHAENTLQELGTLFWWGETGTEEDVAYVTTPLGTTFADRALARRWQLYHKEAATLVLMSAEGHRVHHGKRP